MVTLQTFDALFFHRAGARRSITLHAVDPTTAHTMAWLWFQSRFQGTARAMWSLDLIRKEVTPAQ